MAAQQRNFLVFQVDFEKETGLKLKDNMATYIAYCQLRQAENMRLGLTTIANFLAGEIRKISPHNPRP